MVVQKSGTKKWFKTQFPGVRYREHETRKNGVSLDRYFTIHFKVNGKTVDEACGWGSGGWTAAKAYDRLRELKENARIGKGPQTLREQRTIEKEKKEAEEIEKSRLQAEKVTFADIFTKEYFPIAKQNKTKGAWSTEESLFEKWIEPIIGTLPLKDISPIHLERIKKNMDDAEKSPRTIAYALSIIRQVYNFANRTNLYSGKWPGTNKAVKIPKNDNRRQRYLTHAEADALLAGLKAISPDVHDMALLSLNCGLRAGEVFSLTWQDIELDKGTIFIRDPKNKHNRFAYTTAAVKTMLSERPQGKRSDNIFVRRLAKDDPQGTKRQVDRISKTFNRVVATLGLNKDITDRRQKVVFHSLRHTYASWLVEGGVSLYTVQKLLGHEKIEMTERYSHLSPDNLQGAVRTLEEGMLKAKQKQKEAGAQVINFEK